MTAPDVDNSIARQKERTLRIAWMLSAWAPLACGVAFYLGPSTILLADLLRRSSELLALLLSWLVFLRIARNPQLDQQHFRKQEHRASLAVASVMMLSMLVIGWHALTRLVDGRPVGWIVPGLLIALAGGGVNYWLWRRNRRLAKREPGPLIESQWRFYRAKTLIDACVVITLVCAAQLRDIGWSPWVDALGSGIIAVFLFFSARRIGRAALNGLRAG